MYCIIPRHRSSASLVPCCESLPSLVATHTVNVIRIDSITTLLLELLHPRLLDRLDVGQTSGSTEVQPVLVPPIHLVLVGRTFLGLGVVSGSFAAETVRLEQGGIVAVCDTFYGGDNNEKGMSRRGWSIFLPERLKGSGREVTHDGLAGSYMMETPARSAYALVNHVCKVCDIPLYSALREQGQFVINTTCTLHDTLSCILTWSC